MPKAKQEDETNMDAAYAAIEAAAHLRAREIVAEVFGESTPKTFGLIHEMRKRCIYLNEEDDSLNEESIAEAVVEMKFAIEWLKDTAPGVEHSIDDVLKAFDVLSGELTLEEKVDELMELVGNL